jgi:hypothetical protein
MARRVLQLSKVRLFILDQGDYKSAGMPFLELGLVYFFCWYIILNLP